MPENTRVTITLPTDLVLEIDRGEKNRSRFILEAVQREIFRRRAQALIESLENPHPDLVQLEELGLQEWLQAGKGDAEELLDLEEGTQVHWSPLSGWIEGRP